MMAPSRALRLICHAGAAVPLCAEQFQQSVFFQCAGATPATPLQATLTRFAQLLETPDAGGGRNVCSRACCLNQNLPQRSQASHFARYEMAGDQLFPLLVRAIAKARAAPQRRAREARQNRKCAKARPRCEHARYSPARSRVRTI